MFCFGSSLGIMAVLGEPKMKRTIELKHVGPKHHVRNLLEELIARLEDKLAHVPSEAISVHVVFEENGAHKLYRASLTCHLPGQTVAAHEERRDAGEAIRKVFSEVERQLEKRKAVLHRERLRRQLRHRRARRELPEPLGATQTQEIQT